MKALSAARAFLDGRERHISGLVAEREEVAKRLAEIDATLAELAPSRINKQGSMRANDGKPGTAIARAIAYVAEHPGCKMNDVTRATGIHLSCLSRLHRFGSLRWVDRRLYPVGVEAIAIEVTQ